MSVLEIWGAEYQENDCVLIKPEDEGLLQRVCERERCNMQVIGSIDGSGRVTLVDAQVSGWTETEWSKSGLRVHCVNVHQLRRCLYNMRCSGGRMRTPTDTWMTDRRGPPVPPHAERLYFNPHYADAPGS